MTTLTDTVRIQAPREIAGESGISVGPFVGRRFRRSIL